MTRRKKVLIVVAGVLTLAALGLGYTHAGLRTQFMLGGALANLGYRMQDHLESYDFEHHHDISAEHVWNEVLHQNELSARVRTTFPRTARHPLVAMVVCMDARLDTNELTGDTRHYYYVIRTAGSVVSDHEEDMLELAVESGVKLILVTRHSDCAAEKVAASEVQRKRLPALARAMDERDERLRELVRRPALARRIAEGQLLVKVVDIDTMTERMLPH